MTISAAFVGRFGERLDLSFGEMLARPTLVVLGFAWRNSSEKPAWSRVRNQPEMGCSAHDGTRQLFRIGYLSEQSPGRVLSEPVWNYIAISHRSCLSTDGWSEAAPRSNTASSRS